MKRTLKKSMSILLAFTLLFGSFAFGLSDVDWADFILKANADDDNVTTGTCGENLTWSLNTETNKLTISGTGDMYDWGGSSKVPWYEFRHFLKSVSISEGVTSIGDWAFFSYNYLTNIKIPDSITRIGDYAFGYYLGTDLLIPNHVTSVGYSAFYCCESITSIIIPDSVTTIGDFAFYSCKNLANIIISDSVTNIGEYAFDGTQYYTDDSNWVNSVLYIGNHLIKAKSSIQEDYIVKRNTKSIADGAFYDCSNLISVTIPYGVVSIGDLAFKYCESLTNVEIPNTVASIGNAVFEYCSNLTSATIPNGVKNIGDWAFSSCSSLTNITIPNSVTNIGSRAFFSCYDLADVYYTGTENDWKTITIEKYNDPLLNATIHFNYDVEETPTTEPTTKPIVTEPATVKPTDVPTTTKPVVTEPATTKPIVNEPSTIPIEESTTKTVETTEPNVTKPSTTKPIEVQTTTKPVVVPMETTTKPVTEPATTKPVETPSTTKPTEAPTTTKPAETKPATTEPTKPVETTKPITEPVETTKPVVEEEIIKKPSTSTVKYGETLILHADFANIPEGAKIEWSVEGGGVTIKPSADGLTCAVTSTATGDVTITAKYVDSNGVEHVSEQEIKSNASFWQKIVSFFKNLFGINRIIEQRIKF